MDQFLEQGLESGEVIVSVSVPPLKASSDTVFRTFRASPRRNGNALAYINAAFRAELVSDRGAMNGSEPDPPEGAAANGGVENGAGSTPPGQANGVGHANGAANGGVSTPPIVVKDVVLVFGALGDRKPLRAEKTEAAFRGKELTARLLLEGLAVLRGELSSKEADAYQSEVAAGFLYQFFAPYMGSEGEESSDRFLLLCLSPCFSRLVCSIASARMPLGFLRRP